MTIQNPIQLSAKQGSWQRFFARKHNPRTAPVLKKILSRDNHTCYFCGFRSEKFQEVVNKDANYLNNKVGNMVTACRFCAQCHFLDAFEMDENFSGILVYLPEISQSDLNNLCRVIFHVLNKDSPYRNHVQALYLSLKDRAEIVEKTFGPGSSEPNVFGQALLDCGVPEQHLQTDALKSLRLLPTRKNFKPLIDYWSTTTFNRFPL